MVFGFRTGEEDSSFSEEKEAKRLLISGAAARVLPIRQPT
jgi:hypothetical protein